MVWPSGWRSGVVPVPATSGRRRSTTARVGLGGQDEFEPDGVAIPGVKPQVGQLGGLGRADAILDAGRSRRPIARVPGV